MTEYRHCALDADGHVTATQVDRFESDEVARLRAAIILANCAHPFVEAWDGDRLVCRLVKPYTGKTAVIAS